MSELKWKLGRVLWFDSLSKEGVIIDSAGNSFYVNQNGNSTKSKTETKKLLVDDLEVKFTTYENSYLVQVDKVKIL